MKASEWSETLRRLAIEQNPCLEATPECTKKGCSKECRLFSSPGPVVIPPPKSSKVRVVIVSRDPTYTFEPTIKRALSVNPLDSDLVRRDLMAGGPPVQMIDRIRGFISRPEFCESKVPELSTMCSEDVLSNLESVVFKRTHWTHLTRCLTMNKGDWKTPCADSYLRKEISCYTGNPAVAIVALGRDAEKWILRQGFAANNGTATRVFYIPHPSPANNGSWGLKNKTNTAERIRDLLTWVNRVD